MHLAEILIQSDLHLFRLCSVFKVYILYYMCSLNIKLSSIFPLILYLFIFQTRNNCFLYLHLLLEVVVYGEFSYEVFGFCLDMGTSSISLCIPYVLLAVKSYLFYMCCSRDPGSQMNNCPISIKNKSNICTFNLSFLLKAH